LRHPLRHVVQESRDLPTILRVPAVGAAYLVLVLLPGLMHDARGHGKGRQSIEPFGDRPVDRSRAATPTEDQHRRHIGRGQVADLCELVSHRVPGDQADAPQPPLGLFRRNADRVHVPREPAVRRAREVVLLHHHRSDPEHAARQDRRTGDVTATSDDECRFSAREPDQAAGDGPRRGQRGAETGGKAATLDSAQWQNEQRIAGIGNEGSLDPVRSADELDLGCRSPLRQDLRNGQRREQVPPGPAARKHHADALSSHINSTASIRSTGFPSPSSKPATTNRRS